MRGAYQAGRRAGRLDVSLTSVKERLRDAA
jgi:hypothetical protein